MRPVIIVVATVFGQHPSQMALAWDERSVKAFPADGAHPSLGDRVGQGCAVVAQGCGTLRRIGIVIGRRPTRVAVTRAPSFLQGR
jgi:hypothetical protein